MVLHGKFSQPFCQYHVKCDMLCFVPKTYFLKQKNTIFCKISIRNAQGTSMDLLSFTHVNLCSV